MNRILRTRHFWIVAAMLAISTFLHYFTPQMRFPPLSSFPLTRHTVERIIFILPVAGAAFAYGQVGGLITLAIAVLIMLPRVFLVSAYPLDAFVETIGVAVVSYLVIWMIETQEIEKRLRQKAVEELETINAIAVTLSQSLDLDEILPKVLQIAEELIGADGGFIALLDRERNLIRYPYLHNLPQELSNVAVTKGQGLSGEVMATGRPVVIENYHTYAAALPEFIQADLTSVVAVPIVSGDHVFGTLGVVSLVEEKCFSEREAAILAGIGRQAGIAMDNARLYENMRFYVRQITRAQEDERRRIARELHDETAQALIALSRHLDDLATSDERLPEFAIERLDDFQELIDGILRGVRRFSRDLRPSVLDDLGLLPALEGLMADVKGDSIEAEMRIYGDRRRLTHEAELVLFRIVQEALSNVRRHSRASRVVTEVEFGESTVRISVEDNGQGFEPPGRTDDLAAMGKLGLVGMRERGQLLGGTVAVESELGKGTTVIVEVPT